MLQLNVPAYSNTNQTLLCKKKKKIKMVIDFVSFRSMKILKFIYHLVCTYIVMFFDVMCENSTLCLQICTEHYMKILIFIRRLWIFLCKITMNFILHVYNCEIVSKLYGK